MVVTDNDEIANKCRLLRDHGMTKNKRYWHEVVGYNYRTTNIQAAIGVAQMNKIDSIIEKKKQIASEYEKWLFGLNGITLPPNIGCVENIFWLYTILIDDSVCNGLHLLIKELNDNNIAIVAEKAGLERTTLYRKLKDLGIDKK